METIVLFHDCLVFVYVCSGMHRHLSLSRLTSSLPSSFVSSPYFSSSVLSPSMVYCRQLPLPSMRDFCYSP